MQVLPANYNFEVGRLLPTHLLISPAALSWHPTLSLSSLRGLSPDLPSPLTPFSSAPPARLQIHKTVWRLKKDAVKSVALQFPEGLLMYSCVIGDILRRFCPLRLFCRPCCQHFPSPFPPSSCPGPLHGPLRPRPARFAAVDHVLIMGDVTFGACCIDDLSAAALGADLIVHYGHSCLVPLDNTVVPCMYVFVDIKCDVEHLVATVRHNFEPGSRLALAGTIQFASSMQEARNLLADTHPGIVVPQCKPLSPGEVLGCTAPVLARDSKEFDALLFVADGRFHLEVCPFHLCRL